MAWTIFRVVDKCGNIRYSGDSYGYPLEMIASKWARMTGYAAILDESNCRIVSEFGPTGKEI